MQKFGVKDLQGVIAVTPTPSVVGAGDVASRDTVDLAETDRMIRQLVSDGVDGIMTNGTLGEMATLTLPEWQSFARQVAETAAEVAPDMPLFIGATTLNTRDTIDRIRFLQDLGVRGTFLGRPMWGGLSAETMVSYYKEIVDAFPDMALMLYDNPEAFKGPIPTAVYAELAKLPQVVGAKYIALTPKYGLDVAAVEGKMRLLTLETDWFLAKTMYPEEAVGCWSSSALCGPEPVIALREALVANNIETARHLTKRIEWTYETFLARANFPEFSKYNIALEKLRFDEAGYIKAGSPRSPFQTAPVEYLEGARETGRRWRQLVEELKADVAKPKAKPRTRSRAKAPTTPSPVSETPRRQPMEADSSDLLPAS